MIGLFRGQNLTKVVRLNYIAAFLLPQMNRLSHLFEINSNME